MVGYMRIPLCKCGYNSERGDRYVRLKSAPTARYVRLKSAPTARYVRLKNAPTARKNFLKNFSQNT